MAEKKVDRRVARTRRQLHEALLSLIIERGFDQVTVQSILDRADVGRSTFYAHFLNKTDLLLGNMRVDRFTLSAPDAPSEIPSVAWIFEHAGENLALYRALQGSEAMPHIYRNLNEALKANWKSILAHMEAAGEKIDLPHDAVASYLSHALIGLLVWWLDHNQPHQPEEMDRIYKSLIERGLKR